MNQKLPRREARENAFKAIFASSFGAKEENAELEILTDIEGCELDEFGCQLVQQYKLHCAEIDDMITAHLKGWTLQRLPRVSLTALRVAICEILYGEEKLAGVAINEAVELTKKFGAEDDHLFVNGVLGAIARELPLIQEEPACEGEQE